MILPHALSFHWGFAFLHVFPCVELFIDNNENVVDASTALICDTCAILLCRSDVGGLAECVMYCAWTLNFLRFAWLLVTLENNLNCFHPFWMSTDVSLLETDSSSHLQTIVLLS